MTFTEVSFRRGWSWSHPWLRWASLDRYWGGSPRLRFDGETEVTKGWDAVRAELHQITFQRRVAVLIHGYSVCEVDAVAAYVDMFAKFQEHRLPYDAIIAISWPARSKLGYWYADLGSANKNGDRLRRLLNDMGHSTMDILAHSLGNRVALRSLIGRKFQVRNLFLTNAAVGNNCLELDKEFGPAISTVTGSCLVFHSDLDTVLGRAYRKFGSLLRFWKSAGETALGYNGVERLHRCPPGLIVQINGGSRESGGDRWITSHGQARKDNRYYYEIGRTA